MIAFEDVSVCYHPDSPMPGHALRDVSLLFQSGEWAFLVGPSGAGKSTLLKLVYAGVHASSGRVQIDGVDIPQAKSRDVPALRRKIGVIFQDYALLPQKTVWENVAFALQVIGTPQKRLVREVPRALDIVGLALKQDKYPGELSGGEAQRVAIARAIVNRPGILLADEPTGNLDPDTAWDVAQVLRTINEDGTTILMATHDRTLVDVLKKRVVRLKDGRVVSDECPGVYHAEDGDLRASTRANNPYLSGTATSSATRERERASLTNVESPVPRNFSPAPTPVAVQAAPVPPPVAAPAQSPGASGTRRSQPIIFPQQVPTPQNPASDEGGAISPLHPALERPTSSPTPDSRGSRYPGSPIASPPPPSQRRNQAGDNTDNPAPLGSPENPIVRYDE